MRISRDDIFISNGSIFFPKYSGVHYYYFSYTSNGVRHYIKRGDAETGVEIPEHQDNILDFAKNIESKYGRQVKINTIAYKPWSNAKGQRAIDFLKNLSRSTGGRFKHIKRKDE